MEYFIDTANAAAAAALCRQYPIAGVTTNPTILAREGGEVRRVLAALRVQPVSEAAEGIVREARAVRALVGDPLAIKVPMTPEGLRAMRLLQSEGFPVTATAVFSPQQAILAATVGADYVAPYINRFDTVCGGGAALVRAAAALIEKSGLPTRILCASFRNIQQIEEVMEAGASAVTVTPETFAAMAAHPMTDAALAAFRRDWNGLWAGETLETLLAEK